MPLDPKVLDVKELTTRTDDDRLVPYRRETITFQSRHGLTVLGYFLKPISDNERLGRDLPSGHGRGVDDIVGINEDGSLREKWEATNGISHFSALRTDLLHSLLSS